MELEADIGARIIQIYAQDWMKGGVRFALLFSVILISTMTSRI